MSAVKEKKEARGADVYLPERIKEMERLVGTETALKLVNLYGGCKLYFPHNPKEDSDLARAIGLAAARELGKHFGGETLVIPRAARYLAIRRQMIVFERRQAGETVESLARAYGCTTRTIYHMVTREWERLGMEKQKRD